MIRSCSMEIPNSSAASVSEYCDFPDLVNDIASTIPSIQRASLARLLSPMHCRVGSHAAQSGGALIYGSVLSDVLTY